MPIKFNSILQAADLKLTDIRLLRHKDNRAEKGRSIYEIWRDTPALFEKYQSIQNIAGRSRLNSPYWASFVGTPNDETLFVGLYKVHDRRILDQDTPRPHRDGVDQAGKFDVYELTLESHLEDLIGRLLINWGAGYKSWAQRADKQDKEITELWTKFHETDFPGFLNFIEPLSRLDKLPKNWVTALQSAKGIYLLTYPKTKEQYVGSATGDGGFWQRWQAYVQTGHGGNVALKSRSPSDYQVSILEVAGTASTYEDILAMESRWKLKLQSREMGLNR